MDAGYANNGNFRACIEAQTKHNPQRIHFPWAIDGFEEELERARQKAGTLQGKLSLCTVPSLILRDFLRIIRFLLLALGQDLAEARDKLVENPAIACTQNDEKCRAHRGTDDISHASKVVESVSQCTTGSSDHNTGNDYYCAVPKREERTNSGWSLPRRNQASRHEVNGGDVICIESMAKTQRIGQGSRTNKLRIEVKDNAYSSPNQDIDGDEGSNGPKTVVRDPT